MFPPALFWFYIPSLQSSKDRFPAHKVGVGVQVEKDCALCRRTFMKHWSITKEIESHLGDKDNDGLDKWLVFGSLVRGVSSVQVVSSSIYGSCKGFCFCPVLFRRYSFHFVGAVEFCERRLLIISGYVTSVPVVIALFYCYITSQQNYLLAKQTTFSLPFDRSACAYGSH